jgi:hypothetical protein
MPWQISRERHLSVALGFLRTRPLSSVHRNQVGKSMSIQKRTIAVSCLLGVLALCAAPKQASAQEDMRAKIEAARKRLESERALPEAERWSLDENHLSELESRAAGGDAQASQFLELARIRMAKLRRERYIQKWGRALNDPDISEELRSHARRMAQLRQVRWLAVEKSYPVLVQRAEELMVSERTRHESRIATIIRELRPGTETEPVSRATEQAQ